MLKKILRDLKRIITYQFNCLSERKEKDIKTEKKKKTEKENIK